MTFTKISYKKFSNFFNRKIEVDYLLNQLKGVPKFHLVTGSNDTGKTRLIKHVLDLLKTEKSDKLNLFELNCRDYVIRNHLELSNAILQNIPVSYIGNLKKHLNNIKSISIEGFE
jgi:AAA+ ATPase superfamily predicted ATPase